MTLFRHAPLNDNIHLQLCCLVDMILGNGEGI